MSEGSKFLSSTKAVEQLGAVTEKPQLFFVNLIVVDVPAGRTSHSQQKAYVPTPMLGDVETPKVGTFIKSVVPRELVQPVAFIPQACTGQLFAEFQLNTSENEFIRGQFVPVIKANERLGGPKFLSSTKAVEQSGAVT